MYALFDLRGSGSGSQIYVQKYVGGTFTNVYNEIISTSGWDNDWHTVRVSRDQNNQFKVYLDGALKTTFTDNTLTASSHIEAFVDYGSGVKQGDFDDLRVRKYSSTEPSATTGSETVKSSGNEAPLPYWLENDKKAWVKVPLIPSGTSTIFAYYGDASATSASNSTNVFLNRANAGFDTPDGWTVSGAVSINTASKRMDYAFSGNAGTGYSDAGALPADWIYEFEWNLAQPTQTNTGMYVGITSYTDQTDWSLPSSVYFANNWGTTNDFFAVAGTGGVTSSYGTGSINDGYYYGRIRKMGNDFNGTLYTDIGRTIIYYSRTLTRSDATGLRYAIGANRYHGQTTTASGYIKNALVRKYASPEPTVSSGTEQQADTTPPAVSISSPNASVTYSSVLVPLNFTATDASGVTQCKYELNGLNSTLEGCQNTTITAVSGSNSLKVWAYDGTNWGSASVSFSVQLDNAPPIITITSPEPKVYSASPVPVNFVASDPAIDSCVVRLNGTVNSSSCNNYSLTLGNGAYTLNITANDTFGNLNSSAVSFTVSILPSVSNSTTTNSNGIGNVSLNGIPTGASNLVYSVGSNSYSKSFTVSTGVASVRFSAKATLQGTPAPGKNITFQVS